MGWKCDSSYRYLLAALRAIGLAPATSRRQESAPAPNEWWCGGIH